MPRTNISWYSAVAFCRWISAKTGETITLPTEAQWQLAASRGDARLYPWGNSFPTGDHANTARRHSPLRPLPVDAYAMGASPCGALNMVGNVWEWCITGQQTGDESGLRRDDRRMARGGAFDYRLYSDILFSHAYLTLSPSAALPDVGFRLVRS